MNNNMQNEVLNIIEKRYSTRQFAESAPELETIIKVAEAGILAPFGSATGFSREEVRKVFILAPKSDGRGKFVEILHGQLLKNSKELSFASIFIPKLKSFAKLVDGLVKNGIPGLEQGTYVIIIAEKKGFPPVAKQSIAHALQNMWIYATSLLLGFQMLSAIGTLGKNKEIFDLLGLEFAKYELDGCLVGIPADANTNRKFDISKSIKVIP